MNLKSNEIKKIFDEIIKEEKETHNITFDFHYIGKLTYKKNLDKLYNQKFNLIEKKEKAKKIKNAQGLHCQSISKDMIILFKKTNKIKLYELTNLIFYLYHEIGHAKDYGEKIIDLTKYNNMIFFIDGILIEKDPQYYNDINYHDSMAQEILADMYAVKKTREFFKKNPELKFNEELINLKEKNVNERYDTYNLAQRIDDIISKGNYISANQDVRTKSPFHIFLKEDGTFKKIDDILIHPAFYGTDQRIIKGFLTTESFKESLNNSEISQESQEYLNNLYKKTKRKKLIIQKQQRYKNVKDIIKEYKINISLYFAAYIIWAIGYNLFNLIQKNITVDLEAISIAELGFLNLITVDQIKGIIKDIKNKYDYNYSVSEEEISEFIDILEKKKQENNGKSL